MLKASCSQRWAKYVENVPCLAKMSVVITMLKIVTLNCILKETNAVVLG